MQLKLVAAAVALLASGSVLAQQAAAPDFSSSVNASLVTDYRYRGISQSRLKPAIQGGADVSHKSGVYIGTWASSIRWVEDGGGLQADQGSALHQTQAHGFRPPYSGAWVALVRPEKQDCTAMVRKGLSGAGSPLNAATAPRADGASRPTGGWHASC